MSLPSAIATPLIDMATRAFYSRRLMRAPIWLYRARLGFLLGSRTLMIEHIGRKSGARRYVVVDVVDHPTADTYVVASGLGTRSQWFQNLQANPQARVWIGAHGPAAASTRTLTPDETAASLHAYTTGHPRAWAAMKPAIENTLGAPIDDRGTGLPMVELHLMGQRPEATADE